MKPYLTMWFNSEGAEPSKVAERPHGMGFKPIKGLHDHIYDWNRNVDLEDILLLGNSVHETLKDLSVLYKIELSKRR